MALRKAVIFIVPVVLIGIVFLFFSGYFKKTEYSNQMVGARVIEVKKDSAVVEGTVRSMDSRNLPDEKRTVEFFFGSRAVFKKSVISAKAEQIKNGEPFHPETKITTGNFSDLAEGMGIFRIESKDNLFLADKALASEIDYFIYDFPAPFNF